MNTENAAKIGHGCASAWHSGDAGPRLHGGDVVPMPAPVSVVLVDQIHHHLHHHVLLLRFALGNHQREGHEGVVSDALAAVFVIEDAVVVEEPEEQRGGDAFVSVAERVVLCIICILLFLSSSPSLTRC